jgi:putative aminopeptidase FrvX
MMRKESKKFLEAYLNNASPTGFEKPGQEIWLNYVRPYIDDYITDVYGSVAGIVNPGQPYKVVIEAHADEISWFVNYITEDGYLYVTRNGGSDYMIAPSKRVNIFTEKGIVKGIFGWPAIHVREPGKEPVTNQDNVFIDIGCSKREEVEQLGVHVGSVAVFDDEMMILNDQYIVGRALDNRIGGFMIAEVVRRIAEKKKKLPFSLYIVNAVQEEIGLRGAEMISRKIRPDVAICTDVTHDTHAPLYNKKRSGDIKCGRGPVLTYGPAVQNNLLKHVIAAAEKAEISFQRAAVSRSTGTDTDSFAYSSEGVASALISLPLKYMHTTVETVSVADVSAVIDLLYESVINLEANQDFRYIK